MTAVRLASRIRARVSCSSDQINRKIPHSFSAFAALKRSTRRRWTVACSGSADGRAWFQCNRFTNKVFEGLWQLCDDHLGERKRTTGKTKERIREGAFAFAELRPLPTLTACASTERPPEIVRAFKPVEFEKEDKSTELLFKDVAWNDLGEIDDFRIPRWILEEGALCAVRC